MSKSNNNTYKDVLKNTLRNMTSFSDYEIDEMIKNIPVTQFKKGENILLQGEKATSSYYVIQGCVRQLAYDENGREVTLNFYTEEQDINTISYLDDDGYSRFSLECLEDTDLVVCPDSQNSDDDSPEILNMQRMFFEKQFISMQASFMDFKIQKPIERFESIMKSRPDLVDRVPQNIMANYLGITPETFSRFKKKYKSE